MKISSYVCSFLPDFHRITWTEPTNERDHTGYFPFHLEVKIRHGKKVLQERAASLELVDLSKAGAVDENLDN